MKYYLQETGSYDAVIVGGGPGGSSCAAFLAKKGRRVLLLDKAKFPRDKTCGDGISGKSMKVLESLGIVNAVEQVPHAKITGVIFSSPDGTAVQIPIPKSEESVRDYGYCCRREVFDAVVFQKAKANGATVIENFNVTEVLMEGTRVVGVKGKGADGVEKTFKGKVIVGADGANSLVATKVGVREVDPSHWCAALRVYYKGVKGLTPNIELHFVDEVIPGYVWIFPLENGMANVGVGMVLKDLNEQGVNIKDAMFKALKENALFKDRFTEAEMVSPIKGWNLPFGSKHWRCHGDGWVLVGDAASMIDPFTGERIGNALLSGSMAADAIDEALTANDFSQAFLSRYEERLRAAVDHELENSYRLQRLGRRKWLLNFFLHRAQRSKDVREAIADTLLDSKSRNRFLNPLFYVKALLS